MSKGVTFENNLGPVTVINESATPRPSIVGKLIEIIADGNCEQLNLDRVPAEIEYKVDFNNLKTHQWIVEEFIGSSLLIEESILELNQTILNGSTKLKRQMKRFYYMALAKFSIVTKPFNLEKLRFHSDDVVQEVIALVTKFVKSSADLNRGYYEEDINNGVALIVSYSIVECIVLENPNDHN